MSGALMATNHSRRWRPTRPVWPLLVIAIAIGLIEARSLDIRWHCNEDRYARLFAELQQRFESPGFYPRVSAVLGYSFTYPVDFVVLPNGMSVMLVRRAEYGRGNWSGDIFSNRAFAPDMAVVDAWGAQTVNFDDVIPPVVIEQVINDHWYEVYDSLG